jgi:hypothetical protein
VPADETDEESLLLDRLDDRLETLALLRADDDAERGRVLEEMGARGRADTDIVRQLATARRALAIPDRFPEAHRIFMRGLEVLERNGDKPAPMPKRAGPLKPIAGVIVQQITRWIVKNHQSTLIERVRILYDLREANTVWGSKEHHHLRRARQQMHTITEGVTVRPLGIPTFLVGGAFLSGIISAIQGAVQAALGNPLLVVLLSAVLIAILLAVGWCVLFAAGVARRRIRLAIDEPIHALYQTIGSCGDPPKDQSLMFAIIALVALALAAVVVPAAIGFVVNAL